MGPVSPGGTGGLSPTLLEEARVKGLVKSRAFERGSHEWGTTCLLAQVSVLETSAL